MNKSLKAHSYYIKGLLTMYLLLYKETGSFLEDFKIILIFKKKLVQNILTMEYINFNMARLAKKGEKTEKVQVLYR